MSKVKRTWTGWNKYNPVCKSNPKWTSKINIYIPIAISLIIGIVALVLSYQSYTYNQNILNNFA